MPADSISHNAATVGHVTIGVSGSQDPGLYATSSGDELMKESPGGSPASEDGMEESVIADSEYTSMQTVSTLYPDDSISQRGERTHGSGPTMMHESQSTPDVYSFHSGEDERLFKKVHGRAFTSQSDHYFLPADDEEHTRLNLQHNILKYHLGALYPCSGRVEWLLRENQPIRPAVLDIGTGSGRWPVDMALQFPHADVLGIDLVPPVLLSVDSIPDNCRFEVDDANLSMSHHQECFNVVHVRSAEPGINDFEGFLYEVAQTMRPEGILILATGVPQFWTEDYVPFPVTEPGEEGFSWVQTLFYHCYISFHKRGNFAVDAPLHWKRWLERNPNFEHVQISDTFIAAGAWKKGLDATGVWVAEGMKIDLIHVWTAFKPLLLNAGYDPDWVELIVREATAELRDQTVHAQFQWRYCTAIRTNTPWQERVDLPEALDWGTEKPTLIVKPSPRGARSVVARSVGISNASDDSRATVRANVGSRSAQPLSGQTNQRREGQGNVSPVQQVVAQTQGTVQTQAMPRVAHDTGYAQGEWRRDPDGRVYFAAG
ncbi:hypothetical protein FRB94_014107 [Tulasnella sp. JGI-2019a]|nr:hypothetical protein FRB94_014107 [Tulasnella sp. JGI-2019a]KAG9027077.1 hypothetical protein FRB95_008153 [Tulasnella sp. JGI-2019a]